MNFTPAEAQNLWRLFYSDDIHNKKIACQILQNNPQFTQKHIGQLAILSWIEAGEEWSTFITQTLQNCRLETSLEVLTIREGFEILDYINSFKIAHYEGPFWGHRYLPSSETEDYLLDHYLKKFATIQNYLEDVVYQLCQQYGYSYYDYIANIYEELIEGMLYFDRYGEANFFEMRMNRFYSRVGSFLIG